MFCMMNQIGPFREKFCGAECGISHCLPEVTEDNSILQSLFYKIGSTFVIVRIMSSINGPISSIQIEEIDTLLELIPKHPK